jgi:hypothetical protein
MSDTAIENRRCASRLYHISQSGCLRLPNPHRIRTPFSWTVSGDTAAALNGRHVHAPHAAALIYGSAHTLQIVPRIGWLF